MYRGGFGDRQKWRSSAWKNPRSGRWPVEAGTGGGYLSNSVIFRRARNVTFLPVLGGNTGQNVCPACCRWPTAYILSSCREVLTDNWRGVAQRSVRRHAMALRLTKTNGLVNISTYVGQGSSSTVAMAMGSELRIPRPLCLPRHYCESSRCFHFRIGRGKGPGELSIRTIYGE